MTEHASIKFVIAQKIAYLNNSTFKSRILRVCSSLTCPNTELRYGRRLKSASEDAALDRPDLREERLEDAGTGEDEAVEGGHASLLADDPGRVRRGDSKKRAVSSLDSEKD